MAFTRALRYCVGVGFGFLGRDCGTYLSSIGEGQSFIPHGPVSELASS
jgi:hypothetical protein